MAQPSGPIDTIPTNPITYVLQGAKPSDHEDEDWPVDAASIVFAGAALSRNAAGLVHHLVTGELFAGLCLRTGNNTGKAYNYNIPAEQGGGAAGAISTRVRSKGHAIMPVTIAGALAGSPADENALVYALDGQTFTGSSAAGAVLIGKAVKYFSSAAGVGKYLVSFWSDVARPPAAP